MNMKKILLALGIGAGVGAACYFAKKKLDEMYYDMCAALHMCPVRLACEAACGNR